MGVYKLHGRRHAYAQQRYAELTKELDPFKRELVCTIAGGKSPKELNREEKKLIGKLVEL